MDDLILSEKNVVSRSNKLIEARYKLDTMEQRVIYAIVSCIQPSHKNFTNFEFIANDFAKFIGIPEKNASRDLERITEKLLSRVITLKEKDGNGKTQLHWVNKAKYKNARVYFTLDDDLKPYLLELKNFFSSVKISELISFRSAYSARIYEILLMNLGATKNYEIEFTIEEFKQKLGIGAKEYPLFANLKAKVVEVAIKDINNPLLDIPWGVTYDTKKIGNKNVSIKFMLKRKEKIDKKNNIIESEDDKKPLTEDQNSNEEIPNAPDLTESLTDEEIEKICLDNKYNQIEQAIQRDVDKYLESERIQLEEQERLFYENNFTEEQPEPTEEEYQLFLAQKQEVEEVIKRPCPRCGKDVILKTNRSTTETFWGCSGYIYKNPSSCGFSQDKDPLIVGYVTKTSNANSKNKTVNVDKKIETMEF